MSDSEQVLAEMELSGEEQIRPKPAVLTSERYRSVWEPVQSVVEQAAAEVRRSVAE